jgi:hypothetical protein
MKRLGIWGREDAYRLKSTERRKGEGEESGGNGWGMSVSSWLIRRWW